jgi:hypothetical protein
MIISANQIISQATTRRTQTSHYSSEQHGKGTCSAYCPASYDGVSQEKCEHQLITVRNPAVLSSLGAVTVSNCNVARFLKFAINAQHVAAGAISHRSCRCSSNGSVVTDTTAIAIDASAAASQQ